MDETCVFCKIARGDIPAAIVYEDDEVIAIKDLQPQAPLHLLVVPRQHYADLGSMADAGNPGLAHALLSAAADVGRRHGGSQGYRVVVNSGRHGGQTVNHLHLHVLAGRPMEWPPG